MNKFKVLPALSATSIAALLLSGCAGSAGESDGEGEGFEYGASQEEVDAVLEDLEPVTLTYQPSAQSPNSVLAPAGEAFKDYVEERSNGKITLDVTYGQAIAGYDEIDDALADGRLDVSFHVVVYHPSDYPTYDALAAAFGGLPVSPAVGEAITFAVVEDIGWSSQGLLDDYEAMGITPLVPMINGGGYHPICRDEGSEPDDWEGRQIRVASTAHLGVVDGLGASPVSMEYVEMYEALQRGTVDCTIGQLTPSAEGGVLEVAPNLTVSTDENSLSSRTSPALLAGSSFQNLPLAYQQILFDGAAHKMASFTSATADGNAEAVRQAKEAGGSVEAMSPETESLISDLQERQVEELIDEDRLEDDILEQVASSVERWSSVADEMGLEDGGDFSEVDEWWDSENVDFLPFFERVFEEVALPHRPN